MGGRLQRFMHSPRRITQSVGIEDFMAETEVSDEQYAIRLVLPGMGNRKRGRDG
jgi:hypothetical protein